MSDGFWACIVILVVIIATLEILGPDEISKPSCRTETNIHCSGIHAAINDAHFPCENIVSIEQKRDVFVADCPEYSYYILLTEGGYRVSEKNN